MPLTTYFSAIFKDDEEKLAWLNKGNVAFHGLTPQEMLSMGREDAVRHFLESYLDPANTEVFRG